MALLPDEVAEGLYKIRTHKGGPWVPVRVWLEDGDRCLETGELMSDQIYRAEWSPLTNSAEWFPIDPWAYCNFLQPINEEEFEWLIILKNLA